MHELIPLNETGVNGEEHDSYTVGGFISFHFLLFVTSIGHFVAAER